MKLSWAVESWPIAGEFRIARGAKTQAQVIVATLDHDGHAGRGEAVPYARYGESTDSVGAQLEALAQNPAPHLAYASLPAGAARNAVDCAYWDYRSKQLNQPVHALAGCAAPAPCVTAFTLSLGSADAMHVAARAAADRPLLKIKLGTSDDQDRLRAVSRGAPHAKLIVDANEGWSLANLQAMMPDLVAANVVLIEQPLPAGDDTALAGFTSPVPLCADESAHIAADIAVLRARYSAVNIKLDKAGGLTEALAMKHAALQAGMLVMVGCMVATSLAMAPAMLLTPGAAFVDLDGPLLLARDREPGLRYEGGLVHPAPRALWG